MNVIFVIANMGGGGSERVIANLATEFIRKKIEVTILMTSENDVAYELHEKIKVICIGGQTNGNILKRVQRILTMYRCFKADKTANIISFGTETNLFTILATRLLPNRVIVSERNDPNKCTYKKMRDIIYAGADKLVFQTEDAKNYFNKKISDKGTVICNPISEDIVSAYSGVREKRIVAVGRLTEQKNHKLLLKAFAIFYEKHSDYTLEIYGKGELESALKEYAKGLKIENKVIFKGFQPDVLEKIKDATMYVLSSDYEGVSNSLMEAMVIGLPVISTDCPIGGSKMLIRSGENGILVSMNEVEELAREMGRVADSKEMVEKLSKNASLLREEFSLEKISSLWMELLETEKG